MLTTMVWVWVFPALADWQVIWSCVGGGALLMLAMVAAVVAYLYARCRNPNRHLFGGALAYTPLYDEEAAMPRGGRLGAKAGTRSGEASLREYIESNLPTSGFHPPQQQRPFEEEALLDARYYLRTSLAAMDSALPGIGHRSRKFSFLVRHPQRGLHLMTLVHRGVHCVLAFGSDSGKATFANLLQSLRHPYVYPTLEADFLAEKEMAVIFRAFQPKGSLKDLIHRALPKGRYHRKYACVGSPLHSKTIALFGRQILEGLSFLQAKGFTYGHLHAGNVLLDHNTCRLTDYENGLMNVMPRLQPFFLLLPDRQPDAVAFAHLLFEMATGRELTAHDQVTQPAVLASHPEVFDIIRRVVGQNEGAEALRTVGELLREPFFQRVQLRHHSSKKTRIDTKGIDLLRAAQRASIVGKDDVLSREDEIELSRSLRRPIRGERRRKSGTSSPRSLSNSAAGTPRGAVTSPPPQVLLLSSSAPAIRAPLPAGPAHQPPPLLPKHTTSSASSSSNSSSADEVDMDQQQDDAAPDLRPPDQALERQSPLAVPVLSSPLPPLRPSSTMEPQEAAQVHS